ncbi:MAG: YwaF family protein [Mycoplasmataceae bacterium]|nr:YwaF family protein [Mycoplasmataceae bacterium]
MNINYEVVSKLLPERNPSGYFGFSFLSWQGSSISFKDSMWAVYLIYFAIISLTLGMYIFKTQVRNVYLVNQQRTIYILQGMGFFLFALTIFRTIILAVGGYPNLWELVPFHFCRMFVIMISVSLMFKKINLIKYLGVFAIGGGIIGLLISDLSNSEYWVKFGGMEIGIDNYIFWDFFIIHASSVLLSFYIFVILKPKIYKSTITYSFLSMFVFTLCIFGLNIAFSNVSDPRWRPNWFYLGIPELNGIDEMLEPYIGKFASSYPAILGTFISIGSAMYIGFTMICINSDRLEFILRDEKTKAICFKIKIVSSNNMKHFIEGPKKKYRENYNN